MPITPSTSQFNRVYIDPIDMFQVPQSTKTRRESGIHPEASIRFYAIYE